jgi:large subunit ribosomal protein L24
LSKKPRKQRKLIYTASMQRRRKMLSSNLSPELRERYKVRSLTVRTGDEVTITRGEHEGRDGKVTSVKYKKIKISVEGVTREKSDGTNIPILIHPSKIMITRLNLDDSWRKEILDRKAATKFVYKDNTSER